jgi:FHA domain
MAVVRNVQTGHDVSLNGRTLVGRSSRAELRLIGAAASAEHATIAWDGKDWMIRDLNSRNGLLINGTRLTTRACRLCVGDHIIFGDPSECWLWLNGDAPRPVAVRDDGERLHADGSLLFLPSVQDPEAMIHAADGQWWLEREGRVTPIQNAHELRLGDRHFRIELPELDIEFTKTRTLLTGRNIELAQACFRVSADEEHVELDLLVQGRTNAIPPRASHYVLLVLARARLADQCARIADPDCGWLYGDELASKLHTNLQKLNVDIHRARQLLSRMSLVDNPEDLVQRRKTTSQLRFGLGSIVIQAAKAAATPRATA